MKTLKSTDILTDVDIDKLRRQNGRWWEEWEPLDIELGREFIRRLICMLDNLRNDDSPQSAEEIADVLKATGNG